MFPNLKDLLFEGLSYALEILSLLIMVSVIAGAVWLLCIVAYVYGNGV